MRDAKACLRACSARSSARSVCFSPAPLSRVYLDASVSFVSHSRVSRSCFLLRVSELGVNRWTVFCVFEPRVPARAFFQPLEKIALTISLSKTARSPSQLERERERDEGSSKGAARVCVAERAQRERALFRAQSLAAAETERLEEGHGQPLCRLTLLADLRGLTACKALRELLELGPTPRPGRERFWRRREAAAQRVCFDLTDQQTRDAMCILLLSFSPQNYGYVSSGRVGYDIYLESSKDGRAHRSTVWLSPDTRKDRTLASIHTSLNHSQTPNEK